MAVTKTHPIKSTLKAAIDYILNPEKTDGKLLASSFGCGLETADIISGPLLDRFDIHIEVSAVKFDELRDKEQTEPSAEIKKRVDKAREKNSVRTLQRHKYKL